MLSLFYRNIMYVPESFSNFSKLILLMVRISWAFIDRSLTPNFCVYSPGINLLSMHSLGFWSHLSGARVENGKRIRFKARHIWVWITCLIFQFSSVQFSHSVESNSLRLHGLQHARFPCPSPTPRACSNSCSLSQWCHRTVFSSVVPFSSCPQSFPASGCFPVNQFFASGGQSIGVSASASVLLMNAHDWFLLGWTGSISLQSKGLSRVFSNTTFQKHQFFGTQLSLQSNSHSHTWLLEKP